MIAEDKMISLYYNKLQLYCILLKT